MVNIKVPINLKGAIKIDTADIEDRLQVDKSARNDLQFLKNLFDTGKIIFRSQQVGATGTPISFVPPAGSTFYFLGCKINYEVDATGDGQLTMDNDGPTGRRDGVLFSNAGMGTLSLGVPGDILIGDGIKAYTVDFTETTGSVAFFITFWGYLENSIRP